jgi:hypothetical protein
MNKFIDKLIDFKTLVFISAMFITACAAVFSVSGIGKLFAGAAISAILMASSLELGKIVSISFLYRYWNEIGKTLRWYLLTSAAVLMVITSAGIYGYLSAAYAKVAAGPLQTTTEMAALESQAKTIDADVERKTKRLDQLIGLREQQETRLDDLISRTTTGNSSAVRSVQNQITQYDRDVKELQAQVSQLSSQRDSLLASRSMKEVEISANSDIGTMVYIAKILGTDLDTVVKWFTLVIVLVFDPLAVALIIGFNFLVKKEETSGNSILPNSKEQTWEVYGETKPSEAVQSPQIENIVESASEGVSSIKTSNSPQNYFDSHRLSK